MGTTMAVSTVTGTKLSASRRSGGKATRSPSRKMPALTA